MEEAAYFKVVEDAGREILLSLLSASSSPLQVGRAMAHLIFNNILAPT